MLIKMNELVQRITPRLGVVAILCILLLGLAAAANADITTPVASSIPDPPWLSQTAEPWEAMNFFTFSTDVFMDVPITDLWNNPWSRVC